MLVGGGADPLSRRAPPPPPAQKSCQAPPPPPVCVSTCLPTYLHEYLPIWDKKHCELSSVVHCWGVPCVTPAAQTRLAAGTRLLRGLPRETPLLVWGGWGWLPSATVGKTAGSCALWSAVA